MNRKKILIVEDEAITALELEETLNGQGYEIVGTVNTGTEAIRFAKEKYPDLILMDIRIRGNMDGIETAKAINLYYDIPIIFLTAYSDDLTLSRAIETQSYSYLLKPFHERELFSNIELAISRHRSLKQSIQANRQSMDTMIDLLSDGVIRTDGARIVKKINSVAEKMTGLSREDLVGKNVWEIVSISTARKEVLMDFLNKSEQGGDAVIHWPYPLAINAPSGKIARVMIKIEMVRSPEEILEEEIYILTSADNN